jgi:hypothetical protein
MQHPYWPTSPKRELFLLTLLEQVQEVSLGGSDVLAFYRELEINWDSLGFGIAHTGKVGSCFAPFVVIDCNARECIPSQPGVLLCRPCSWPRTPQNKAGKAVSRPTS